MITRRTLLALPLAGAAGRRSLEAEIRRQQQQFARDMVRIYARSYLQVMMDEDLHPLDRERLLVYIEAKEDELREQIGRWQWR